MSNRENRQLVVMVKAHIGLRVGLDPSLAPTMTAGDVKPLVDILKAENIVMRPLFGKSEDRLRAVAPPFTLPGVPNATIWDLSTFYVIDAPDERLNDLAQQFCGLDHVASVHIQPQVNLPMRRDIIPPPIATAPPSITPDFVASQTYLDSAPGGIDARFAWTMTGGTGTGVQIIDIEQDWRLTHEDLLANMGGLIAGTPTGVLLDRSHGTAVLGVIGGDDNGFGVEGIASDANLRVISSSPSGVSPAIYTAASMLSAGDIILIEQEGRGPHFAYAPPPAGTDPDAGYVAIQFWPPEYAAIGYATTVKGIIVVEAAGNGFENLDDAIYNNVPSSPLFPLAPPFWCPFNRATQDNGSIIIGAGAPPPGTHGRDWGPDRSRLDFSNFGSCVDAQGWGSEVTTCGFGNLQAGPDEDLWYTDRFNGTSSAAAMLTGTLACLQGALKAEGKPLLTPITARQLLRDLGSAQQDAPGRPATERIGNRPNLLLMMASIV